MSARICNMLYRVLALSILIPSLLSGCATPTRMAYSDESKSPVAPTSAVFLMTATIKNSYHTSFQPDLLVVNVEKAGATEKSDRLNFTMDKKAKLKETGTPEDGNSYLLRLELPPGQYVIRGLTSVSRQILVNAFFFAPLHENVASVLPGVFYLGHVDATVRERKGEEFKAGPTLPLIDQAVAGASGGTFDVEISDRWVSDEAIFRDSFSQLGAATVQKSILPPFDRAQAQEWWEKH
jgi:hypothetical protein